MLVLKGCREACRLRIADFGLRIERISLVIRNPQSAIRNHHVRAAVYVFLLTMLLCAFTYRLRAEEIDRLLASVNGKVITEGDLLLARNLNAILSFGQSHSLPSRKEEIDRLIDLELMRQELESFPVVPQDQSKILARIQELKNTYAEIGGLQPLLHRLGLQESELLDYVRLQDSILRFIDFRFLPFASVSEEETQEYYREKLVPPLRQAGAPVPPLAEVSAKIKEILREEKVSASMNQWMQDIRRHARIEYFLDGAEPPWGNKR